MSEPALYINHYEHCDTQWDDSWSCMCNDDCPKCGHEIEPYASDETQLLIDAEIQLGILADAQTKMWDAALELEELLDIEIDTTNDMENETIQSLLEDKE